MNGIRWLNRTGGMFDRSSAVETGRNVNLIAVIEYPFRGYEKIDGKIEPGFFDVEARTSVLLPRAF